MLHKKQMFELVQATMKWNQDRDNLSYSKELEISMLEEELKEFKDSIELVDEIDALADLMFVLIGSASKKGLSPEQFVDVYAEVVKANNTKSKYKDVNGKIIKPKDFVGPEARILEILRRG